MPTDTSTGNPTEAAGKSPPVEDETDGFFGLLTGLYAAFLLAPGATSLAALYLTTDPAALFFILLGSVVSITGVVGWYARPESVAVRLGRTRWVWLAVVVPFGYAAILLFSVGAGLPSAVAGVSMLGMIAALFSGMGLAVAAQNRHAKAVLAETEEIAQFDARAPERDRYLMTRAAAVLVGAGVVGLVIALLTGIEVTWNVFTLLVPIAAGLIGRVNEKTLRVTEAGLFVEQPLHRTVKSWDEFESFSVTADALVVHRAKWSPFGLRDVRRDPDDIADPEAVASALAAFLPRR